MCFCVCSAWTALCMMSRDAANYFMSAVKFPLYSCTCVCVCVPLGQLFSRCKMYVFLTHPCLLVR